MKNISANSGSTSSLEKGTQGLFHGLGRYVFGLLEYLGGLFGLGVELVNVLVRYRFPAPAFFQAFEFIGIRSLSIVSLVSIFTGMVFALQFSVGLSRFGLQTYVGQVIGLAISRELGPVLTCLMLAARVGAGIAAELGSMVVTEQVMAIEALGANPVHKLVLPRVLAMTLAAPLLATMGNIIGVIGGMWIAMAEAGVTSRFYFDQIRQSVEVGDYFSGIAKTVFFGFFIGLIACYQGLKTSRGTEGVGKSTTYAVVISSITVFVADFFLTKLFIVL